MLIAIIRAAAPLLALAVLALIVREALLHWQARRVWKRFEREARAHFRSRRFLDDRRPRREDVTDVDFEEVR